MAFEDQEVESLEEFEKQVNFRFITYISRVIDHALYVLVVRIGSRQELETSTKYEPISSKLLAMHVRNI